MEWAKVKLTEGSWRGALVTAASVSVAFGSDMPCWSDLRLKFIAPRISVYQALCEYLEAIDRITDATECIHEMECELAQETNNEQATWIISE